MKVLHISTSDHNGAGLAVVRIHKSLLAKGIDSKILCAKKRSEDENIIVFKPTVYDKFKQFIFSVSRKFGVELNKVSALGNSIEEKLAGSSVFYTLPITNFDLSKHALVKEADVIHLHWVANFIDFPTFFRDVKKPIVWTLHDEGLYYGIFHFKGMYDLHIDKVRQIEYECSDVKFKAIKDSVDLTIVSLSTMLKLYSEKQSIVSDRKHVLIHNGVDTELYKPHHKLACRKLFNIPIENKVLFFVCDGINDPRKGIKELVKAIEQIDIDNITLVAVGGDKVNFATDVDIKFLGYIRDEEKLSKAYSCADLFVLPSFQEAFAQTPLEAMACGIPVVMFPCSGSHDLINDTNGIIAVDFTVDALKDAIQKGLSSTFDADIIRQMVIDRFAPEIIADQYIEVYNDVLKR